MKKYITVIRKVEREVELLPCYKCGCEDIGIYRADDNSFDGNLNNYEMECRQCGNRVIENNGERLIELWNKENNPEFVIKSLEDNIQESLREIDRLRTMKNK